MSQQINLFNPIFLVQQKHFSLLTIVQALGLILLGSSLFYAYAVYQVSELSKQSAETSRRFAAEQARLARQTTEFSSQNSPKLLQDQVDELEKKVAESKALADALRSGAGGNTTGYSEYMRAFARQAMPGLWLTEFNLKGDGTHISLSGGALEPGLIPAYIQRLRGESIMQGKRFSAMQIQQPIVDAKNTDMAQRYVSFNLQSAKDEGAGQ